MPRSCSQLCDILVHVGMQVPICEIDPWRTQYFESVPCPADVFIPTEDSDALDVESRASLGLRQARRGARARAWTPRRTASLRRTIRSSPSRSTTSRAWAWAAAPLALGGGLRQRLPAGSFLDDPARGRPCQQRRGPGRRRAAMVASCDAALPAVMALSTTGRCSAEPAPAVEDWCGAWCRQHLKGYTGLVNLETIGGRIIEVHLRFADQWPDLYGGAAGSRRSSVSMRRANGGSTIRRGAPATASCCSRRTGGAIAIRRRPAARDRARCRASRACRSPSTKSWRPAGMPCRRAAFGSRSSTAGIAPPAMPRATGCAPTSRRRRLPL